MEPNKDYIRGKENKKAEPAGLRQLRDNVDSSLPAFQMWFKNFSNMRPERVLSHVHV